MSGQKTLDAPFFAKMGRLLALWRLRRAVSAVRCLIYLNTKMRRLRSLWKFRHSASIASMIGSSWVRRAREIRFGAAIERLQACNRVQPWLPGAPHGAQDYARGAAAAAHGARPPGAREARQGSDRARAREADTRQGARCE
eukprot:scaffold12870_cov66-Phaeocystis_antarctica.AAC.1